MTASIARPALPDNSTLPGERRSVLYPALAWAGFFTAALVLGLRAWFH